MSVVFVFEIQWRYIVKNIKFIIYIYNNPQPHCFFVFVKTTKGKSLPNFVWGH